jgi:hypothetical protein
MSELGFDMSDGSPLMFQVSPAARRAAPAAPTAPTAPSAGSPRSHPSAIGLRLSPEASHPPAVVAAKKKGKPGRPSAAALRIALDQAMQDVSFIGFAFGIVWYHV